MTADPSAEPSPRALGESLAQLADLRGEIRAINERLDQAGLRADLNLADRFEDLARTVADALDATAPRGPAAPYWIGLDRDTYHARLVDLQRWADTVLCSTTAATSSGTAGPITSTPSGNCLPWLPSGTGPIAATAPTWLGPWSSTTAAAPRSVVLYRPFTGQRREEEGYSAVA